MARPRKDPERRQRRNTTEVPAAARAELEHAERGQQLQVTPPAPIREWLKVTKDAWADFWDSDLAVHVLGPDVRPLVRLFRYYDLEERAGRVVARGQNISVWMGFDADGEAVYADARLPGDIALGSQGQLVKHPSAELMLKYGAEIRQLEDRFGLTPRSRYQLGFTFGAMSNSLGELNATIVAAAEAQDDPRSQAS